MVAASTGDGRKAKGERRLGAGERGGVGGGQSKEGSDRKGERAVVLWRGAWSGGVWWQSTVVCVCGLCVKCGVWLWGVGCQDCRCLVSRETRCARIRIGKIRGSNLKLDQVEVRAGAQISVGSDSLGSSVQRPFPDRLAPLAMIQRIVYKKRKELNMPHDGSVHSPAANTNSGACHSLCKPNILARTQCNASGCG